MKGSLATQRDRLIRAVVAVEVDAFLAELLGGRLPTRRCAWCGKAFQPRQRWHFFCTTKRKGTPSPCRMKWYGGQFKTPDALSGRRRRRAA